MGQIHGFNAYEMSVLPRSPGVSPISMVCFFGAFLYSLITPYITLCEALDNTVSDLFTFLY